MCIPLPRPRSEIATFIRKNSHRQCWWIAQRMHISDATVFKIGKEMGMHLGTSKTPRNKKSEILKRVNWVKEKTGKVTLKEISAKFGMSMQSARHLCQSRDLDYVIPNPKTKAKVIDMRPGLFNVNQCKNWLVGYKA